MTNNVSFLQIAGAKPFSSFLGGKRRTNKKRTLKRSIKKTLRKNKTKNKTLRKNKTKKKTLRKNKTIPRRKKTIKRVEKRTQRKKDKNCKCNKSKKYSGNEPSPKGLGYCAHCTPLHVTMKGKDGNLWENVKFKNSRRWVKVREDMIGGFLRPGTV